MLTQCIALNLAVIEEIVQKLPWTSFDRMALDELYAATMAHAYRKPAVAKCHLGRFEQRCSPLISEPVHPHLEEIAANFG